MNVCTHSSLYRLNFKPRRQVPPLKLKWRLNLPVGHRGGSLCTPNVPSRLRLRMIHKVRKASTRRKSSSHYFYIASCPETTPHRRPTGALASSMSANIQQCPPDREFNSERPSKIHRISGVEFGGNDASTPRAQDENLKPTRGGKKIPQTEPVNDMKSKLFTQPPPTNPRAGPSTLSDYSTFKGKGRYSKRAEAGPRYVLARDPNYFLFL